MSDLTKRLRSLSSELKSVGLTISNVDHETCLEAADEIERLQAGLTDALHCISKHQGGCINGCWERLSAREKTDRE